MHCPDCETLLESARGTSREACPACGGEWFELPALALCLRWGGPRTAPAGDLRPESPPRTRRRCPVCRALLRARPWPSSSPPQSVWLCPLGHGAWLLPGELDRLHRAAIGARRLLQERSAYYRLLAREAAREFERASRPARGRFRGPIARLLGPWL
ncbi:MAG: hypothetical protein V3U98_06380 [Acidobacteriota bacterium]